jgi:hypothetical protein
MSIKNEVEGGRGTGKSLPFHEPLQRVLDEELGLGVKRAGGLVEDEHRRVLEEGAGNSDALLLAAREGDAALADERVVAVVERVDQGRAVRPHRRRPHRAVPNGRPGPIRYVVRYRPREEHRLRRHHPSSS